MRTFCWVQTVTTRRRPSDRINSTLRRKIGVSGPIKQRAGYVFLYLRTETTRQNVWLFYFLPLFPFAFYLTGLTPQGWKPLSGKASPCRICAGNQCAAYQKRRRKRKRPQGICPRRAERKENESISRKRKSGAVCRRNRSDTCRITAYGGRPN